MDVVQATALEQARLIKTGKISAEELMRETLAQIGRVNKDVNAIVSLRDADTLLAEARAADNDARMGWMHGLPIAIKDLADAAGLPTSMGSPIHAGQIADQDELLVARLRAAGALIIGKTNTPEFGLGSHTFNPVFGATCNPYDLTRSAGGSSGGAAAALAARMLAFADGSDMMGSLRNPAAWNNVYGFRPSWGVVPPDPDHDLFLHQLSTSGPMARCPRDLAAMLDVISGPDPMVPLSRPRLDFSAPLGTDLRGTRIGWLGDWGGAYPMEDGIIELSETAMSQLEDLGCRVEPVAPPFAASDIWEAWITLRSFAIAAGSADDYNDPKARALLKPAAMWEIERGRGFSAPEIHRASAIRSNWFRAVMAQFESYDALVLPSAQVWPFPVDWVHPQEINGVAMDTYHRWMEVVIPVSLIGLPAVNLPAGFGENGLPMGIQVFGRPGSDMDLLNIATTYHDATNWPSRRPLFVS